MRKIFYLFCVSAAVMLTSCFEDTDNWYSETSTLDGRYVVATTCEQFPSTSTPIEDRLQVMIYNSAANVSDEVWIQTTMSGLPVKAKFKITGNAAGFEGITIMENANGNTYYIDTDEGWAPFDPAYASYFRVPTEAGLLNDGILVYSRATLEEGKIIPKGATTIGGNVSDSIYLKMMLHSDYVQFVSYLLPESEWEVAGVPQFEWMLKEGSNTPVPATDEDWPDETWTLSGYRYTGYPEDE